MAVDIELRLDDRGVDRVLVTLALAPSDGAVEIDGAALQLTRHGEPMCPRVLVPVRGLLSGPMATTLELRVPGRLPPGCRVVGTAWWGPNQVQVDCPADPFTTLRDHLRSPRLRQPDADEVILTRLEPEEYQALVQAMPWLVEPSRPEVGGVIEAKEDASDLKEAFGLDEEAAEWLEELLSEPDL